VHTSEAEEAISTRPAQRRGAGDRRLGNLSWPPLGNFRFWIEFRAAVLSAWRRHEGRVGSCAEENNVKIKLGAACTVPD
jgi:hypothetical protein